MELLDQFRFMHYLEDKVKPTRETFVQDSLFKNAVLNADVLGLSADSYNYGIAKLMICSAKEIKPTIKTILGGIHPSQLDAHVARTSGADVVLRGEAEGRVIEVLYRLVEGRSLSNVPGITYVAADGAIVHNPDAALCSPVELAQLAKMEYDLIADPGLLKAIPVETSRGCSFRCRFCSVLNKGSRRLFPLDHVQQSIIEASKLKDRILFTDDSLTGELERTKAIFSMVNAIENLTIHFEARASDIAKENNQVLDFISDRKVPYMQLGVECGYDWGLTKIKKGITIAQVEKSCDIVSRRGMASSTFLSFIIGFPWEGMNECLQTIDFAKRMNGDFGVNTVINFWIPAPSELWLETKDDFGVTAAMYDDCSWAISNDIFLRTHPMISSKDRTRLSFLVNQVTGLFP